MKTETCYKLTTKKRMTHDDFSWEIGKWYRTSGNGNLCGSGWLHAYTDPFLAVFLNPIHADIEHPILWEAEGRGKKKTDNGLKVGYTEMRIVKRMRFSKVTKTQRIAFGILCAKEVCEDTEWNEWADKWLSGEYRSKDSAARAEAAWVAAGAWAAARAWAAGAWAAAAARATAAEAALQAARAAAAVGAEAKKKPLDLIRIANEAMKY